MEEKFNGTHLYFIRDRLSSKPETAVIQSLNDAVAVRGFKSFLLADDKRRTEQNVPLLSPLERELVHICALDEDNHVLPLGADFSEFNFRVVCNGENVDDYLKEITESLRGE